MCEILPNGSRRILVEHRIEFSALLLSLYDIANPPPKVNLTSSILVAV